jgi:hypothetical protein
MLKKIFGGEYPLGVIFWKYGIITLTIFYYIYKFFQKFWGRNLGIFQVINNFNFHNLFNVNIVGFIIFSIINIFMIIYSVGIIKGVWRASASYEKSVLLAYFARMGIIISVIIMWYMILNG